MKIVEKVQVMKNMNFKSKPFLITPTTIKMAAMMKHTFSTIGYSKALIAHMKTMIQMTLMIFWITRSSLKIAMLSKPSINQNISNKSLKFHQEQSKVS